MQSSIRGTFAEALCKWLEKEKRLAYSTKYSQAVSHPSTNLAQCCLTAVIWRELVLSTWNGRRHLLKASLLTHFCLNKCAIFPSTLYREKLQFSPRLLKKISYIFVSKLTLQFAIPMINRSFFRVFLTAVKNRSFLDNLFLDFPEIIRWKNPKTFPFCYQNVWKRFPWNLSEIKNSPKVYIYAVTNCELLA